MSTLYTLVFLLRTFLFPCVFPMFVQCKWFHTLQGFHNANICFRYMFHIPAIVLYNMSIKNCRYLPLLSAYFHIKTRYLARRLRRSLPSRSSSRAPRNSSGDLEKPSPRSRCGLWIAFCGFDDAFVVDVFVTSMSHLFALYIIYDV